MARGTRSPRATSTGPGRSKRPRAGIRASASLDRTGTAPGARKGRRLWLRGAALTRRMLVLVVVVLLLAVSFASSLRIYLGQQHDLAVADQAIRDRTAQVSDLQSELARWDDPDYVKTQARQRLGWVMPGETGYRVIGEDGEPLGGGVTIQADQELPAGEHEPMWWDRMWGSIETADSPERRISKR